MPLCLLETLNIKFLWIDSLCIIQDDQSDWEVESSLMAEIYSNVKLTIVAPDPGTGAEAASLIVGVIK